MARTLVIVESPAKAKTIGKFLGRNYKVKASIGHVRDLPKSKLGIDIENEYTPKYITIRGKGKIIKELKAEAKKAKRVLLATDPDREGEAISWHLANILSINEEDKCRIEFNEITSKAIKSAVKKPRPIKKKLVDAQQARRILDRLVGYSISPLLWKKIMRGLSAGRVQSVATKLICDREKEIEDFKPEEYWTIDLELNTLDAMKSIEASFHGIDGKKTELKNSEEVNAIINNIKNKPFEITNIDEKLRRRKPYSPFTTSSLQQEASNKFGYSTRKTMILAQQLYEGIDVEGEGTVGLITYIRTDSIRISDEAKAEVKDFILKEFSEEYLGKEEKKSKNNKASQDAHEAIRPTSALRSPVAIKNSLSKDQFNLYRLIWERFVSSQMADATYSSLNVDIVSGEYLFKAKGTKQEFDGFLKVYTFTKITEKEVSKVEVGEKLKAEKIDPKQHFTQPPARYTEASLVKEMEEKGIGRPSTYAPTISTILSRGYVEREAKSLKPTELGVLINEILENNFDKIVNIDFTATMESNLDKVEEGEVPWIKVIDDFYTPFKEILQKAEESIEKIDLTEMTDEKCPKCDEFLAIKHGRFGKFLACSNYPECSYTRSILNKTGVDCPRCDGDIVIRRSRKGRIFYGCSNFPNCNFMTWNEPTDKKCPECESILVIKKTKKKKTIQCSSKECKYKKDIEDNE